MSIFVVHKVCARCGELGHRKEMVRRDHRQGSYGGVDEWTEYMHKGCDIKAYPNDYCRKCKNPFEMDEKYCHDCGAKRGKNADL